MPLRACDIRQKPYTSTPDLNAYMLDENCLEDASEAVDSAIETAELLGFEQCFDQGVTIGGEDWQELDEIDEHVDVHVFD